MPLGDPYAALSDLKERLRDTDIVDDTVFTAALAAASDGVEDFTGRQFNDAGSASARRYRPVDSELAIVDDLHTTTGLIVETDDDDDGTFETTWDTVDYELEPLDGVHLGVPGWPFWKIRAVGSRTLTVGSRSTLRVTARWGWATVPAKVKEATLILAEDLAKLRDTPFGAGGFGDLGRIRARENPHVVMLLQRYRRNAVLVG